jgi:hypothetical protein
MWEFLNLFSPHIYYSAQIRSKTDYNARFIYVKVEVDHNALRDLKFYAIYNSRWFISSCIDINDF